jgi:DNA mismatch endonuclease (patch repair protein)
MADNVSPRRRSEIMRNVRSKNTSIEMLVRRELWRRGVRFRVNVTDLPGKPDIAIKKLKVVIFIDSCFWHGCPQHGRIPKSNVDFWRNKISRNVERDRSLDHQYQAQGWYVIRVWEHDVLNDLSCTVDGIISKIRDIQASYRTQPGI